MPPSLPKSVRAQPGRTPLRGTAKPFKPAEALTDDKQSAVSAGLDSCSTTDDGSQNGGSDNLSEHGSDFHESLPVKGTFVHFDTPKHEALEVKPSLQRSSSAPGLLMASPF